MIQSNQKILNQYSDNIAKKRKLKGGFIIFLTSIIIGNVIYAWALPNLEVECAKDTLKEYLDYYFDDFSSFKANLSVLNLIFIISDLIFIRSLYKNIFRKGNLQFFIKIFSLIAVKILVDWMFYQHNIYFNPENFDFSKLQFSLLHNLSNNNSGLLSLPISIIFLCALNNEESKQYKFFQIFHISIMSFYLLFSNLVLTYQVIFSFLVADYNNRIVDKYYVI